MRATVTILYEDGLPVPRTRKPVMVEVDVDVSTGKHPVTSRVTTTAWTSEPATATKAHVRPMHDVVLLWIAFRGLRIRGMEIVAGGREVAQEWFIVPLPDAKATTEQTKQINQPHLLPGAFNCGSAADRKAEIHSGAPGSQETRQPK